jgi:hypothetical protein
MRAERLFLERIEVPVVSLKTPTKSSHFPRLISSLTTLKSCDSRWKKHEFDLAEPDADLFELATGLLGVGVEFKETLVSLKTPPYLK